MTDVAKALVGAGADATILAIAFTVDVDPAAVLVAAGSATGGVVVWLAQGWWKSWREEERQFRRQVLTELSEIKKRHDKEDGAAEASDRRHR